MYYSRTYWIRYSLPVFPLSSCHFFRAILGLVSLLVSCFHFLVSTFQVSHAHPRFLTSLSIFIIYIFTFSLPQPSTCQPPAPTSHSWKKLPRTLIAVSRTPPHQDSHLLWKEIKRVLTKKPNLARRLGKVASQTRILNLCPCIPRNIHSNHLLANQNLRRQIKKQLRSSQKRIRHQSLFLIRIKSLPGPGSPPITLDEFPTTRTHAWFQQRCILIK